MNYTKYKNLETDEVFEGLEILSEFETFDIIERVNRFSGDEYKTEIEWLYEISDDVLIYEMERRDINPFSYSDFDVMLKELINEVPEQYRTMHFKVMLDRIERDFNV